MASTPDILSLLSTVFQSILEVFLLCLAGYILAWRRIIDKPTQRVINHINISLFTPALLFSKVAFFLSPAKLKELWIIPIFFVVVTGLSGFVAVILSRLFRLKKSQRNFAMAASMFMNSNSLPIALMQSLVLSVHGLKWTPDDNKDAMLGRALTYLVLYSTLGMMLRWSYGVRLLSSADIPPTPISSRSPSRVGGSQYADDDISISDGETLGDGPSRFHPSSHDGQTQARPTSPSHHWQTQVHPASPSHHWQTQGRARTLTCDTDDNDEDTAYEVPALLPRPGNHPHRSLSHPYRSPSHAHGAQGLSSLSHSRSPHTLHPPQETAIYHSFPNSPSRKSAVLSSISVTSTCSEDDVADEADIAIEPSQQYRYHTRTRRVFRRVWKGVRKAFRSVNSFMTVPLWASILSLIVACVAPLQSALERMEPVKGALGAAGNCSIPLTLVVLGAYFYSEPQEEGLQNEDLSYSQISERQGLEHQASRSSLLSAFQEMFTLKRAPQYRSQTRGEGRTVFVAILARMVVVPAVMLPVMAILAKLDFHDVFE
ncbi:hypothetical protein K503DRAFT_770656, partial [Rhizopogon vinicolor AM-OR11-026]